MYINKKSFLIKLLLIWGFFSIICWPDFLGLTQDYTWDKKNTSFSKQQPRYLNKEKSIGGIGS